MEEDVCVPGGLKARDSKRLVELVDLYPTLAELMGLTPPSNLEGRSLKPLLNDPDAKWDFPAYTQVARGPGHSVRTERWRYTQWASGNRGEELYDHDGDRQEMHNLAKDAKYAAVAAQMKELLKQVHPKPVQGGKAEPGTRAKYSN